MLEAQLLTWTICTFTWHLNWQVPFAVSWNPPEHFSFEVLLGVQLWLPHCKNHCCAGVGAPASWGFKDTEKPYGDAMGQPQSHALPPPDFSEPSLSGIGGRQSSWHPPISNWCQGQGITTLPWHVKAADFPGP